jgi:SPP1 gp7 family putative phage head morphogenesis protein
MLRFNVAKLSPRKSGRVVVKLTPPRLGPEREYQAALRAMLNGLAKLTREVIIPAYADEIEAKKGMSKALSTDADESWFTQLKELSSLLTRTANATVDRILGLEAKRHTDDFSKTFRKAVGIDLRSLVREEDLTDYMAAATARNASLIRNLSDDIIKRIEQTVLTNSIAGNSASTLRKALQEQYGITARRAKIIARDQIGKFNSDLDRIRQEQAGVEEYEWETSMDERVRPLHRSLNGKIYKWGEATGAEGGLAPGQPILCRCGAKAVITFGEGPAGPRKPKGIPPALPLAQQAALEKAMAKRKWTSPIERQSPDSSAKQQAAALSRYKGADPKENGLIINYRLRNKPEELTPSQEETVNRVDDAFIIAPKAKQPTIVYRGLEKLPDGWGSSGKLLRDKGYTSTTTSKQSAETFSTLFSDDGVVIEIEIPKGARFIEVDKYSDDDSSIANEKEILLPRGGLFEKVGPNRYKYLGNGSKWSLG